MARFCTPSPAGLLPWFRRLLWLLSATGAVAASPPIPGHFRWSNPLPHGNNVFSIAYSTDLHRGLQVTERGLIHFSDDLVNWLPREAGTERALRAVAFLSGGRAIVVGEEGAVFYSDDLSAETPLATATLSDGTTTDWLEGVAASSDLAVAVGDNGTIYTSADAGLHWKRQSSGTSTYLTSVTYGSNGFVAVGEGGLILHSPNGSAWSQRTVGTRDWLRVASGNGRYLAVGRSGAIATSANGKAWTVETSGRTNDLWAAAVGPSVQLAAGSAVILLGNNSGTWTDQTSLATSPAPQGTYFAALARTDYFLVGGRVGLLVEGTVPTNAPGTFVWNELGSSIRTRLWDVTRTADLYAAVGERGAILTSSEGHDWSLEYSPRSVTNTTLLGIGGDTNLLVAAGAGGALLRSPNLQTNLEVTVTSGTNSYVTNITSSTLGVLWQEVAVNPSTNQLQGVTAGHGLYVVVGDNGEILTSAEGNVWSRRTSPTSSLLSGAASWTGGFLACGQGGVLVASPGGVAWRKVSSPTTAWLFRVRWLNNTLLVAVGESGTLLTSADGTNWVARASGTSEFLTDVTFLNGRFVATGQNGTVLASADGITWTAVNPFTYRDLYAAAVNGDGQLVVMGQDGVILRNQVAVPQTPAAILNYSHLLSPSGDTAEDLFLFAGSLDQRFVLESATSVSTGTWSTAAYLEFLEPEGTLAYLSGVASSNLPPQRVLRTRLLP